LINEFSSRKDRSLSSNGKTQALVNLICMLVGVALIAAIFLPDLRKLSTTPDFCCSFSLPKGSGKFMSSRSDRLMMKRNAKDEHSMNFKKSLLPTNSRLITSFTLSMATLNPS
jgi:hypothetical protein